MLRYITYLHLCFLYESNVGFWVFFLSFVCFVYVGVLTCMSCACGGQKRTADPLELQLQMLLSCCVGAMKKPNSSGRTASALTMNHLSNFLSRGLC